MLELSPLTSRAASIKDNFDGTVSPHSCPHSTRLWLSAKEVIARILSTTQIEEIELKEYFEGSFNVIFRFQIQMHNYVLRVRRKESDFAFEKIAKEPFAILALKETDFSDQELRNMVQNLFQKQFCGFMEHPIVGKIYYSDWSKQFEALPYIFCISEWKEGKPLYSVPKSENFEVAGKFLAEIHRRTFASYYPTILDIGSKFYSLQDSILSIVEQQYKKALINSASKSLLDELLQWVKIHASKLPDSYEAVLCHYDFSGSNLIVNQELSTVSVLDFDNWRVSIREDDFPKLLHWTIIDPMTGKRTPSSERIEDFVRGYRNEGGKIDERLLRLKEAEWLLRVYAHSLLREQTEPAEYRQSSFPSSNYYEQAIYSLLYTL